ncbi:hypothetical protein BH20ACT24_BH20ACT24_15240 [soil metagenome]
MFVLRAQAPSVFTKLLSITLVIAALAMMSALNAGPALAGSEPEGGWKNACKYTQSRQVDPIVSPGVPSAHLHEFFGTRPDENSTYESLRAGGTVCPVKEDTAGYWIPALYTEDSQGNRLQRKPISLSVYYQAAVLGIPELTPFPPNLKVIAGNAMSPPGGQPLDIVWFDCAIADDDYSPRAQAPYLCPSGGYVRSHIKFPSCWDGVLPAPVGNDSAHLSYPDHGTCSEGTIPVPELHFSVNYAIQDGRGATLASGGGMNDPNSIYTMHADFFHAWEQGLFEDLVGACLNEEGAEVQCGTPKTPVITRMDPPTGQVGDRILVGGSHFVGVKSVKFNGMPAAFSVDANRYINAVVPPGATTGLVTVTTDADTKVDLRFTGTSTTPFTVT